MGDNKNLFIALGLALLVMIGYDKLYLQPKMEAAQRELEAQDALKKADATGDAVSTASPAPADDLAIAPHDDLGTAAAAPATKAVAALPDAGSVKIETPELKGSLSLRGARFDDLVLVKHSVSLEDDRPVRLLTPLADDRSYFVRFGWAARGKDAGYVPGDQTVWTADNATLTPDTPVTLFWTNEAGVRFTQKIEVDKEFMFKVTQSVTNSSGEALDLAPYGLINRDGQVKTEGLYILHEGPLGVFNGTLEEKSYSDLEDDGNFETSSKGGWLGITDKYWMTVLIPDQNAELSRARFVRQATGGMLRHRVDYVESWQAVAAGSSREDVTHFYAGAKIVSAIDDYETKLDIPLFDRAIDWGWFYWLTRPIFKGLHYLFELTGNFGIAILVMTVLIKLALFPLANKSYVSMSHMKMVQPKIKALQERHKDDKARLQQEMMELYKKEKINPLAGCLPVLVQIPIFFSLYKVLYVTIEMRHQPFFGWVQDLSAPDHFTPVNLFGLIPWDPPAMIAIGVWPILMGLTMWLQQKMNPQTGMDPTQAKVMMFLPIIFTFMLAQFAAGLVIYWTWNSLLSVAQQWVIMRREEARVARSSKA